MLSWKQIKQLEYRLSETDRELETIIKEFFPNEPLSDMGDTAKVVELLQLQAECVEALALAKIDLRKRNG